MKKINIFIIALPLWVTAAFGQTGQEERYSETDSAASDSDSTEVVSAEKGNAEGYSGYNNTITYTNTFVGVQSGPSTYGHYNAFLGAYTGYSNTRGRYNTYLGHQSGYLATGYSNVFVGYRAGYNETGSNKLYIDNSSTSTPLIWGDFSSNILTVNGRLGIGTTSPGAALDVRHDGAVIRLGNTSGGGLSGNFRGLKTHWDTDMAFFGLRNYGTDRKDVVINNEQASDNIRLQIAGSDKVFIGGNGNVGIGTAAPTHRFHVVAADAVGLFQSTGSHAYLRLSTSEGIGNRVEIANRPGGRLALYVPSAGDVLNVLRSGRVGIGTHTPNNKLDVRGQLGVNGNSGNYNWLQWWTDDDTDHPAQLWDNERDMRFGTWNSWAGKDGWSEKMRITGGGNVGIGTTTPREKLHVAGNIFANMGEGFRLFGDADYFGSYQDGIVFQMEDGNSTGGHTDGGFVFRGYTPTDGVAKNWMVVKSGGRVGINTTAPATPLHVEGWGRFGIAGKSNSYLQLEGQDGFHRIAFSRLRFYDWNTARDMVTFENDKVGIGTTAPAEALHVNGNIRGNQAGGALRIRSAHGYVDVGARNTGWAHFITDRPRFYFNAGITVDQGLIGSYNEALQLQTAGTTRLTVSDTDGDVTIHNNLIVDKTIRFDASTLTEDNSIDNLMMIRDDGSMATRSVASIESPWMFGEFFTGRDTLMMICPDSTVVGNITIDVIDLNGNLRIGDNAYLDDDIDYGGINDDWMRFNDRIEFMSVGDKHGIVLYDKDTYLDYTNLYHEAGTTYLANDHGADRYFLKATGRDVAFGGRVTVPDLQVRGLSSDTSLIVTIDEDNNSTSDLFAVRANGTAAYRELLTVAESGEVTVPAGSLSVPAGGIGARHARLADSLTTAGLLRAHTARINNTVTAGTLEAGSAAISGSLTAGAATVGTLLGTTATFTGTLTAATIKAALPATATVENLVTIDELGHMEKYPVSGNGLSPWTKTGDDLNYTAGTVTTARLAAGTAADADIGLSLTNTSTSEEVFRVYGDGHIRAKELKLTVSGWEDRVFAPEYALRPLEDLESYLAENRHLPEVPAEADVLANGVNVGEMETLLLKKIEELTLYIIAQNKQLKAQNERIKQLEESRK